MESVCSTGRGATARPCAGAPHEHLLCRSPTLALLGTQLHPASFRAHLPRGRVVGQEDVEAAHELLLSPSILDWSDELDAMIQIPGHQVCAADQDRSLFPGVEDENA